MPVSAEGAVARLVEARTNCRSLEPLSASGEDFTEAIAWTIQDELAAEMTRRGKAPIGWKLAATGPTGQAVLGVTQPAYGLLLADVFPSGAEISRRTFVELGVEAEIAFRIGKKLSGPNVTAERSLDAVDSIMPALELPDLIFSGSPKITDFIASSMGANGIVLGQALSLAEYGDLAHEQVTLEHNGQIVGTNMAAEVMGHPLNALAWLANQLAARGRALMPGEIVMSGGISKLVRGNVGDAIAAKFSRLGSVSMKVVP